MRTVHIENDYAVAPERLWAVATSYDALAEIMQGLTVFQGLPSGRARTGQKLEIMVSLFGRLPAQPYVIEILECDDDRRVMQASEQGAGVKSWHHTLSVTETATGSRLSDHIQIEAGLLTPVFVLWARYLYQARHKPREKLLQSWQY
ncbi:hypothetical protein OS190_07215 [Sulfitobacter sp. F26204]|uniref:SRPBCC family protein n=1 Tax=Sulfitobacter sp. F26204 TaxID=2996014 RepID=UPI00225E4AC8|nr:SRPBCC family protein [Sulfitobacter sp. F26204]MCX7559356.1 hypothetical protein [Sulfitobacter sp. F26204]